MSFTEDHNLYISNLQSSLSRISDADLARKRLTYIRWKVSENLEKLLFEFETNVKKTDSNIIWCPDEVTALEQLNRQIKSFDKIGFFRHNAVRHFVNELDLKLPEESDNPEVIVAGAKFIIANTGNIYISLNSKEEFDRILKAKKVVVIAGIDSVLALQSELNMARQLYALYETGKIHYEAEIIGRPGRIRGLNAEIVLLLTDINKSRLLDQPAHRPLFSLLNFDLAAVCPMQKEAAQSDAWKQRNTLSYVQYAFMHGTLEHRSIIEGNYGLRLLNHYLPYDIDLYEQILDARAGLHNDDKTGFFGKLLDSDKSALITQARKFTDPEKFRKFAEHNFFGSKHG